MSTPHNQAEKGQIAKTVLMPGDPLRAKYIAETFLENPVQFNTVRNMFGYTGTYNGKPVSVMGSGMGMPSIGIYSYELFKMYDVDNIIRIGSAGAYCEDLNLFDTIIADSSWSESTYAKVQGGYEDDVTYPSEELNAKLIKAANDLGIPYRLGRIHSSDAFYHEDNVPGLELFRDESGQAVIYHESHFKAAGIENERRYIVSIVSTVPGLYGGSRIPAVKRGEQYLNLVDGNLMDYEPGMKSATYAVASIIFISKPDFDL